MDGGYVLTVVTDPKNSGNIDSICLKTAHYLPSVLLGVYCEKEIDEVYKKIGIQKSGNDFFVIVNYICRDFGLKFVSSNERKSAIPRFLIKSALLEKK